MQAFTGSSSEWNQIITQLPNPHLLQSWEWSQVKAKYDWQPIPFFWKDSSEKVVAAAMILKKQILRRGFAA
ncbi:MAG TPA: hypothetical protein VMT73_08895, partial [Anaerolineales bacterium]|nr:hypothetical protein [Anaerolineales bacterium]